MGQPFDKHVELTVFGFPEILTFRSNVDENLACYRTHDKQDVLVYRCGDTYSVCEDETASQHRSNAGNNEVRSDTMPELPTTTEATETHTANGDVNTAAPTKVRKKAAKKSKAKKATKKAAKTKAKKGTGGGRSDDTRVTIRLRMFKALNASAEGLTGVQIKDKLKLSGIPNILRDEGIVADPPRIRRKDIEGVRGVVYELTAAGRKALENGTVNSGAPGSAAGKEW